MARRRGYPAGRSLREALSAPLDSSGHAPPGSGHPALGVCDHRLIVEPPILSNLKARLAALHDLEATPDAGAPGVPTPGEQLDAMRESMEILSDPELAARVRAGRHAVASAEVVGFEELGGPQPAPGQWRVVLTAPVARQLAQMDQLSGAAVREVLTALTNGPAERGRALGMGLVGMRSARGGSHRILYAMQGAQRLVTVVSLDDR